MAFECGGATIADIFACLWFTKVVSCDLDSSAITNVVEQQKIGAVVTSGVAFPFQSVKENCLVMSF